MHDYDNHVHWAVVKSNVSCKSHATACLVWNAVVPWLATASRTWVSISVLKICKCQICWCSIAGQTLLQIRQNPQQKLWTEPMRLCHTHLRLPLTKALNKSAFLASNKLQFKWRRTSDMSLSPCCTNQQPMFISLTRRNLPAIFNNCTHSRCLTRPWAACDLLHSAA